MSAQAITLLRLGLQEEQTRRSQARALARVRRRFSYPVDSGAPDSVLLREDREMSAMSSSRSEFLAGVRAELPLLLGVIPFGLIYGAVALSAGLPADVALAMSPIVFAGSAQFVGARLIRSATPAAIILLTTFVINLRHVLYSASVAPHLKQLHPLWKWLLAYLLTDEAYAVVISYYHRRDDRPSGATNQHWYFLGAGLTLWSAWQGSTAVGVFVGAQVPAGWALDFTLALTFIALVVPALNDRPSMAAAASAGAVAVLAADLPLRLGLVVAALTGILVGLWLERRSSQAVRPSPPISPDSG